MLQTYKNLSQRLTGNLYILSTREAFVALIPFLILTASLALLTTLAVAFNIFEENPDQLALLADTNSRIYSLLPLLTLISLSYYLGKSFTPVPFSSVFLSVCCFSATQAQIIISDYDREVAGQFGFYPSAIIIPFIVVKCLDWIHRYKEVNLVKSAAISAHLRQSINLIIPYFIVVFGISLALYVAKPLLSAFVIAIFGGVTELPAFAQGIIRVFVSHLLWFLGIHGDNTYSLLVDSSFLGIEIAPNTRIGDTINFFSLMGGSGTGLSLIIAILLFSKDQHSRHIGKISIPFAIFNINEILIFGLPIVFNPYLIIPFILVPVINFIASYVAVSAGLFVFTTNDLTWITPPLINSYLASGGDITALGFQLALLILGVFIYRPFLSMSHLYNSDQEEAETLAHKLAIEANPITTVTPPTGQKKNQTKPFTDVSNLIEEILAGDLQLKYQPVIEQKNSSLYAFNLQVTLPSYGGKIVSTNLLNELKRQSLSTVIFTWKLNQLFSDLEEWSIKEYKPKIILHLDNYILNSGVLSERFSSELKTFSDQLILSITESSDVTDSKSQTEIDQLNSLGVELITKDFNGNITNISQVHKSCIHINSEWFLQLREVSETEFIQHTLNYLNDCTDKLLVDHVDTEEDREAIESLNIDLVCGDALAMPITAGQVFNYQKNWQPHAL